MIDSWLSIFSPSVLFRYPITTWFFRSLPLKIALRGAIPSTLRTIHLNSTEDIFRLLSTNFDSHKIDLLLTAKLKI